MSFPRLLVPLVPIASVTSSRYRANVSSQFPATRENGASSNLTDLAIFS